MKFDKEDVVAVMCNSGEFVGRFIELGTSFVSLRNPRMIVQTQDGVGFAHGICITGEADVGRVDIFRESVSFVTKANTEVEKAYVQATSGIII